MDNWQDRTTMLCGNCVHYVPKERSDLGRCRKHAPTLDGWPVMFPTDFCGDHKLNNGNHSISILTAKSKKLEVK